MKKILSFVLTVAMLASMVIIPTGADTGNAAFYFDSVSYTGDLSIFQQGYMYDEGYTDTFFRPDQNTGEYNYTMVFDLNVQEYAIKSDSNTCISFSHHLGVWNFGYSFNEKAFYLANSSSTSNPNVDLPYYVVKVGYDLVPGTWYEIGVKFQGRAFSMYVNGVKMFTYDSWAFNDVGVGNCKSYAELWEWMRTSGNLGDKGGARLFMFTPINCAFYADNLAVYSGDYDFGTGEASETFITASEGLVKKEGVESKSGFWGPFNVNTPCGTTAPNGGTEKVTYDREFAASHTAHNLVYDEANSKAVTCTTDGYDLYSCVCGASEYRNYQYAPGHNNGNPLGGRVVTTIQESSETDIGIKEMRCPVCGELYTEIFPLTGEDKALRLTNSGLNNFQNGYLGINDRSMMVTNDGMFVSMDIFTISHRDNKNAKIAAHVGGDGHDWAVGYDFYNSCFYIEDAGERLATAEGTIDTYVWHEWGFRRAGTEVTLYIDGEAVISHTMSNDIYNIDGTKQETKNNSYMFYFLPSQTDLLLDNLVVASPDYDVETGSGYIYRQDDMTQVEILDNSKTIKSSDGFWSGMLYTVQDAAGYASGSYGRPAKELNNIHREMSIYLDTGFENKSVYGYSQYVDTDAIKAAYEDSNNDFDLEYAFDFKVTDWCTDSELLNGGTAMIGSHVNGLKKNGFAGYDFLRQEFVIADIAPQAPGSSAQAGGNYADIYASAPMTVARDEWHRFGVKYFVSAESGFTTVTITFDGDEVLSYTYEDELKIEYLIMFPNYIKGYFDNVYAKLNSKVYDVVDYTNASDMNIGGFKFIETAGSIAFTGVGYSLVDAPADDHRTHVYSETVYPASCETRGYTVYTCSCGESTYTRYNQDATGHSWDSGVVVTPPTTTSTGVMRYTCLVCGATRDEEIPMEKPTYVSGDANGDGLVNSKDALQISRKSAGWKVDINAEAADVTGDGLVNSKDALLITRKNSGWNINFAN